MVAREVLGARGSSCLLVVVATLLTLVCTPRRAFAADTWTDPYPGVRRLERRTATQALNVLVVDLTRRSLRLRATTRAERGQVVSSFARARGCQAAINGDFFSAGFAPTGLAMGGGARWAGSADDNSQGFVAVGRDNRVEVVAPSVVAEPAAWMSEIVGGRPLLVRDGVAVSNAGCGAFCGRNPRSALGVDAAGTTLYLVVVDGRRPGAAGMSLDELAALLVELGAHRGLGLDGGGSSTMYLASAGGVINTPSDGAQRVVANHLALCVVEPIGELTGYVRAGALDDASAGVAGAEVTLSTGQTVVTDADGRYQIADVAAGDVTISVVGAAPDQPGLVLRGERAVFVAADDLTWGSVLVAMAPPQPDAAPGPGAGGQDAAGAGPEPGGCAATPTAAAWGLPALVLIALTPVRRRRPRPARAASAGR